MKPNFDAQLKLDDDGTRVEAKGPLDWEGAKGQCRVEATIVQGQAQASGRTGKYGDDVQQWDTHADTNGATLEPGPASAFGVLTFEPNGGGVFIITWPQQVELRRG